MDRRAFLKLLAASAPLALAPGVGWASPPGGRVLVLVQLDGGNDGLNTVIPYADPRYRALRPGLGIARERVLQLTEGVGLHPALAPLMPRWEARELAVVQGLGYAAPNRSHFRSQDIWETASRSDEVLETGWVARALGAAPDSALCADAIALGGEELGPLAGAGLRALVVEEPEAFIRAARRLPGGGDAKGNPALTHILKVQRDIKRSGARLDAALREVEGVGEGMPRTPLGRQLQQAARLIAAGSTARVFKVVHGGFDTHAGQLPRHERLLEQLAEGLAAFAAEVKRLGRWEDVLVATYSEFGRRAEENASGGTDHGTAAPHLLLGGRVRGGLYGEAPSLTDLDAGELRYTTEVKAYYATLIQGWGGEAGIFPGVRALPALRT